MCRKLCDVRYIQTLGQRVFDNIKIWILGFGSQSCFFSRPFDLIWDEGLKGVPVMDPSQRIIFGQISYFDSYNVWFCWFWSKGSNITPQTQFFVPSSPAQRMEDPCGAMGRGPWGPKYVEFGAFICQNQISLTKLWDLPKHIFSVKDPFKDSVPAASTVLWISYIIKFYLCLYHISY